MDDIATSVTIKNILVATDFSPLWKVALPLVSDLAKRYCANITLLHAIPAVDLSLEPCVPAEDEKMEIERARARLEAAADAIDSPSSEIQTLVLVGDTVQSVVDTVTERQIDLVVISTHGRVGLARLVLGSTAEQILRSAPCPVLTIGPKTNPDLRFDKISTVLAPLDVTSEFSHASNFAVELARKHGAKIVLLNIIDDTMPLYQIASVRMFATRELANIDTDELETKRTVRVGVVENEIVAAAAEFNATCLVMARHKHGVLSTHLPFTTLRPVLLHAPCPVFTVA